MALPLMRVKAVTVTDGDGERAIYYGGFVDFESPDNGKIYRFNPASNTHFEHMSSPDNDSPFCVVLSLDCKSLYWMTDSALYNIVL